MKTTQQLLIGLATWLSSVQVQWGQPVPGQVPGAANVAYTVTERGPHHRTWNKVVTFQDEQGRTVTETNMAYVELTTGIHYWADGQWKESQELIESYPDGAIAQEGGHKVIFANNLNTAGAIELQMPDGQRMRSHVLGLSYFDPASGQSVLIAEVKDCQGQIVPPNRVVYPNAFTDLLADVRYTYTKGGFEQDVILQQRPPLPEEFGLDSRTTRLQVMTEFDSAPSPGVRTANVPSGAGDLLTDEVLDFGAMRMVGGKAFVLGNERALDRAPVGKQWLNLDGRRVLVEEVAVPAVAAALNNLPQANQASVKGAGDAAKHKYVASVQRQLPKRKTVKTSKGEMQVAKLDPGRQAGLVLDYSILSSSNNFTFQGDTTYYVSGTVNLSGTTKIEGGTVVKFTNSSSATINLTGPVSCQTGPYRPAVFTAKDDNTVGETISGSTGSPAGYYGSGMTLGGENTTTLHDLRFSYANSAVIAVYGITYLANAQFVKCRYPIDAYNYYSGQNIVVDNGLFYESEVVFNGNEDLYVVGNHLTVNRCGSLGLTEFLSEINLTNSLVVAATNGWGSFNGGVTTNSTAYFANDPGGIFQTVGAASHYLADNTYRNAGTTNINATLANDLKKKTTYSPFEITTNITGDTVLSPQALCDTNTPDLGYHYDPLDYVVSGRTVSANLTLTNGVALGTYGASSSYGLGLSSGSLVSEGTPDATELDRSLPHGTGAKHDQLVGQLGGGGGEDAGCAGREHPFYRLVGARRHRRSFL